MSGAIGAIIGAAETDRIGFIADQSAIELHAEAARNALADCGLTIADVDGVASAAISPISVAHYLGIRPEYVDHTWIGGCSFVVHLRHALAAIEAGLCTTVLITHGESGRSRVGDVPRVHDPSSLQGQYEVPFGTYGPTTLFPIGVLRYMHEHGLTHEQLAAVPVVQRLWATDNPRAMRRELITVDDVLDSRMIAYPMHLLECCLLTDGGGAVVVTSADRAEQLDLPKQPVYVLGAGEASETPLVSMMEDFTSSRAFEVAGRRAMQQAQLTPSDVDHLMIYDAFAHVPIFGLEDLGFVERGAAGAFIEEQHTAPGGSLPMNTNGGGLSYTHTGMYGMFLMLESIRQLRGEAVVQVPDLDVSFGLAAGGMFNAAGAVAFGSAAAAGR
jgi:acetyl-CoA acetyltransferase